MFYIYVKKRDNKTLEDPNGGKIEWFTDRELEKLLFTGKLGYRVYKIVRWDTLPWWSWMFLGAIVYAAVQISASYFK